MPAPLPSRPPGGAASHAPHLYPLDVVRVLTVAGVIAVHSTSVLLPASSQSAGAALTVLHATREIFLMLSAFVLTYASRGAVPRAPAFWRRRVPLVAAPYTVWSAIYLLTGGHLTGIG